MMRHPLLDDLRGRTDSLTVDGLLKRERVIASPQSPHLRLDDGTEVLNFCANNYLGLADDPRVVDAAIQAEVLTTDPAHPG